MRNDFNPWAVALQGQQSEQGLAQAELEGMSLRERQAFKRAAGQLGSQNYFAGYEGVPGAERPDFLKEAWASADPQQALQLEQLVAEPFKLNRQAEQAGKIEAAKKASDLQYTKDLMDAFYTGPGAQEAMSQGQNAFGTLVQAPGSGVLLPGHTMSAPPVSPSATERNFEITPQGPKFGMKTMSPFEQSMKVGEDESRKAQTEQAKKTFQLNAYQNAVQNVRDAQATLKGLEEQVYATGQGMESLGVARQDLIARRRELDQVMKQMQPNTAASSDAPPPLASQAGPTAPVSAPTRQGAGLPGKIQQELTAKSLEQKATAANKEIDNARLGVEKVTKFLPQIKELHDLVTTQEIGHPALDSVYGAGNVLSLNRSNAQVKRLNEAIINMFAEPGQSQMMNTIVERQMQGAVVPGLFTEPQLNRINSAILLSNVEHLRNLPTFLEKWQQTHGGNLTGAADAWIDYTDHNRLYTHAKDARGNVTVKKQSKVPTPEAWQALRESGKVRDVQGKTFVKQSDGSWMER